MVRVLLVSPFSDNLVGGIVNWTRYVVNYHKCINSDVDLVLLNNANASSVSLCDNVIKRFCSGIRNYSPILRDVKQRIRNESFDAVHICTSASLGLIRDLLLVRMVKTKRIRTFVHFHFGRIPVLLESNCWEGRLLKFLLKRIDCAVVMDKVSLNSLKKHGFCNSVYLPNPLSTEVERLIKNCKEKRHDINKIVFAGHVCPTKGVLELVEACRKIENVTLEIIGKETVPGTIKKMYEIAGENSDTWLTIRGNKPMEFVIAAMKQCAVFVLPSYTEGFPNVILESMACGCPIVATRVGAIPEMLAVDSDQPCGICVSAKNVEELRKGILCMIQNPKDAIEYGQRAQKRVNEQYAMSVVWGYLVNIWGAINKV